jgi:hypothetical protein
MVHIFALREERAEECNLVLVRSAVSGSDVFIWLLLVTTQVGSFLLTPLLDLLVLLLVLLSI